MCYEGEVSRGLLWGTGRQVFLRLTQISQVPKLECTLVRVSHALHKEFLAPHDSKFCRSPICVCVWEELFRILWRISNLQ